MDIVPQEELRRTKYRLRRSNVTHLSRVCIKVPFSDTGSLLRFWRIDAKAGRPRRPGVLVLVLLTLEHRSEAKWIP